MIINTVRCRCGSLEQPGRDDMTGTCLNVEACGRCHAQLLQAKNDAVKERWREEYRPPPLEELEQYAGPWD